MKTKRVTEDETKVTDIFLLLWVDDDTEVKVTLKGRWLVGRADENADTSDPRFEYVNFAVAEVDGGLLVREGFIHTGKDSATTLELYRNWKEMANATKRVDGGFGCDIKARYPVDILQQTLEALGEQESDDEDED